MRHFLILVLTCIVRIVFAQQANLVFIGHNTFDEQPLLNCSVVVLDGNNKVQDLNTGNSPDFKLVLPFGKNYKIQLRNSRAQSMYLSVIMDNIPEKLYSYKMTYELRIPYFPKDALTIDTTQFKNPFHKVVFNGKDKMVDDTVYMNKFLEKVFIKKEEKEIVEKPVNAIKWTNLAGKFNYDNSNKTPVVSKKVNLVDHRGNIVKTTVTNKFGSFLFSGVDLNDAHKVELDFNKEFTDQKVNVELSNTQRQSLGQAAVVNNKAAWQNTEASKPVEKLIDPRFSYKISAKLIGESGKKSVFYSGKTVFLLNDKNTIVKRTKTNALGSFVFTDVKPGYTYMIGVDKGEVPEGHKIDLYTNREKHIAPVDSSLNGNRFARRFSAESNPLFNELLIDDSQLKMDIRGKLFGENVNNPLSDVKIVLLNDKYEPIDTTTTDNFGKFIFKYLPYNQGFNLAALHDKEALFEAISNVLVYDNDDNVIKIVSNFKGKRFSYKPLSSEQSRLTEIYAEDPWLPFMDGSDESERSTVINESILFESNKSEILPDGQKTLEKIVMVFNANPKLRIELSAHTDSKGNDQYNQTLSEQRAKSATDYIIGRGIETSRVIAKGYGETKIINRCKNGIFCPDDEHQENRRIEIKILKN